MREPLNSQTITKQKMESFPIITFLADDPDGMEAIWESNIGDN
jgi:hypothetical protein